MSGDEHQCVTPAERTEALLAISSNLLRLSPALRYGLLSAAAAIAVGCIVMSGVSNLYGTVSPVAVGAPATVEMMQMLHDEHALITSYLKEYSKARQQDDLAAEQAMLKSKAAERAEIAAANVGPNRNERVSEKQSAHKMHVAGS